MGVLPVGSAVVPAASAGLSCNTVCEMHQASESGGGGGGGGGSSFTCAPGLLPLINTCQHLREHFRCSQCLDSVGSDQPGQVSLAAPSDKLPGACLINNDPSLFSCSASWEFTSRLCVCAGQ